MSRSNRMGLAAALLFALCAGLAAQDFSDIKVQQLAKGLSFTEGPAWSKDGYLIFSDTPANRLMKWMPGHEVEVFRADVEGPAGNAFDGEGRLYTCETRARRVTRTDKKGALEVLAERWEGKRLNAPDDVVVSRNGHVYFTDPAFGAQSDHRELDFYGVYHIPPKGPMKLVARPAGRPNGIALSHNGRILYVVNSDERNVRAYDVDHNGDTSNERVLISGIPGVPGGIRTDESGNLYVAAGGIAIYSAEGKPLHVVEMHGRVSNCGFGEADNMTLFVTAGVSVYRLRMDVKGAY
ncbi:MAG TPA: SMP-30/gluconolactonase/LRE family protein [Bryobacteraceae bacterium]|nr:SMP-30/gluconolactonase/LRE family protein [Bryobacteraceae bacterium]